MPVIPFKIDSYSTFCKCTKSTEWHASKNGIYNVHWRANKKNLWDTLCVSPVIVISCVLERECLGIIIEFFGIIIGWKLPKPLYISGEYPYIFTKWDNSIMEYLISWSQTVNYVWKDFGSYIFYGHIWNVVFATFVTTIGKYCWSLYTLHLW